MHSGFVIPTANTINIYILVFNFSQSLNIQYPWQIA
jgi:hypothetical protein